MSSKNEQTDDVSVTRGYMNAAHGIHLIFRANQNAWHD